MMMRMTAAWGANVTSLLVNLGVFLALLCIFAAGIALFAGQVFLTSLDPALTLLIGFWLLAGAAFRFHGGRVSGQVLSDFGPYPTRNLLFFVIVFCLISEPWAFAAKEMPFNSLNEFLLIPFFLFTSSERFQIRENGIWQYGNLLRWHRITSYRWTDDGTLVLGTKSFMAMPRGAMPVPSEHKEAVNAFLLEHAPQAREL